MRNSTWQSLQRNAIWVYEHYFASDVRVIAGLLQVLGQRIRTKKFRHWHKPESDDPIDQAGSLLPEYQTPPGYCQAMAELEAALQCRGHAVPKGGFPVDRECTVWS